MAEMQRTLKAEVCIEGVGLHTGNKVKVVIKPSEVDTWFRFKRVDIEDSPFIEALVENVSDTSRGTTIAKDGIKVCTVEHVLAALCGLKIDNAIIETNAAEMPILDGSATILVEEILKAGIIEQEKERKYYEIPNNIEFTLAEKNISIRSFANETTELTCLIDYSSRAIAPQFAKIGELGGEDFINGIAPCRTFVFLHEIETLLNNNLIKGGDLDNAIVFVDKEISKEELEHLSKLFNKTNIEVKANGTLNNIELKFTNEAARHKLLDIIGDMALLGCYIKGKIIAQCPGHYANIEFVKKLKAQYKKDNAIEALPKFDINAAGIYDINAIKELLPHRNPFLLVDKIAYISDEQVIGVKNVTMNEQFFVGHFPQAPVMPGVLQIEAMAQVGGIYMLTRMPKNKKYLTYFLSIDKVKFRSPVVPGDTLIFKLIPMAPLRRGLCQMKGWAYVGKKIVMEAELLALITEDKK